MNGIHECDGNPLVGRLMIYDALQQSFTELKVDRNPQCPRCGDGEVETEYAEYAEVCAVPA